MKPFTSPDELVYRYVEKRQTLSAARALSIQRSEGYKFEPTCEGTRKDGTACESTVWTEKINTNTGRVEGFVCFSCGAPWRFSLGRIMPAEIDVTRRTGVTEDQLTELATLERLLGKLTIWERRVWAAYLLADLSEFEIDDTGRVPVRRRRVDALQLYATSTWPRAKHGWYRSRVWGLVKSAREKATAALRRAGYWEG